MQRTRKEEREYWLFSKADQPTFARARNDVPLNEVFDATEEEAKEICTRIRKELEGGEFCELWINILVYFNDTSAIGLLETLVKQYKEKHRTAKRIGGGFSPWIRLLKDAIKHLKRVQ